MSSGINWDKEYDSLVDKLQKMLLELEGEKIELDRQITLYKWQITSLINYKTVLN